MKLVFIFLQFIFKILYIKLDRNKGTRANIRESLYTFFWITCTIWDFINPPHMAWLKSFNWWLIKQFILRKLFAKLTFHLCSIMAGKEPVPLNFVHQNAILCETIKKEQKHQKLHKDYRVNPFKKSMFNIHKGIHILKFTT